MVKSGLVGGLLLLVVLVLFALLLGIWPVATQSGAQAHIEATLAEGQAETRVEEAKAAVTAAQTAQTALPAAATPEQKTAAANTLANALTAQTAAQAALTDAESIQAAAEQKLKVSGKAGDFEGYWTGLNQRGVSLEFRLMLVVLITGALGSAIHAARAFAFYIGRNAYDDHWTWWYFLRVPTGAAIALLVYFVLKAGLITGNLALDQSAANSVNIYGFAALAAMAGLFSNQAYEKLEETFNTFFRTAPKTGEFSKAPLVEKVSQATVGATGQALIVTIKGRNFDRAVEVRVGDKPRKITSPATPTELKVELTADDVKQAGKLKLVVVNPEDKGGSSKETQIDVVAAPAPVIKKVADAKVNSANLDVLINGMNFDPNMTATLNGTGRDVKFTDPSEASVVLLPADVAAPKEFKLKILNPDGKGGASNEAILKVA